jgi:hypothetical protein
MGGTVGLESDKSNGSDDDDTEETNSHGMRLSDESSSENDSCRDKLNGFEDERIGGRFSEPAATQERQGHSTNQADPLAVFFRILQNMAQKKLKTCAEAVPRSKIENIGIASAAALGIQLALRRPHKKKSHFIEYVCASIATMSFGTILTREAFLGNIHDKQTMQIVCKDLASSIMKKIKKKSASNKSLFAMIVLVIFCRRKQVAKGIPAKDSFFKR